MAGIDVSKVLVGAPDQKTTGAINNAPLGTALPTDATAQLDPSFTSSGYVSQDGLELATDRSTNDIKEWGGATVKKILESFDGTIAWSEIQMSYEALCHAFGADNVQKIKAAQEHGEQIIVKINASLPPARSWVFNMKDGSNRIRIVVPSGQVTSVDTLKFAASEAIALPITLSCYPDENGDSILIYTDDGVKAGA